jgi:methyl-accepting chemotaxis protein
MTGLASGDTSSAIPHARRTDEIGSMAGAVEVFRQTASAKIKADQEIEANRTLSENERQRRGEIERAAGGSDGPGDEWFDWKLEEAV